jgi:hypothetical protein
MLKIAYGQVPIRTVTHFCITGEDNRHIRMQSGGVKGTRYLFGYFGTLDLRTEEGQRLSMGNWDKVTNGVWGWLKMEKIHLRRPTWFRDGYSELQFINLACQLTLN